MKIHYHCEQCGQAIDSIEVQQLDEAKLGFDVLTNEERQQLLYHDPVTNAMYVQSLCDGCIEAMGMADEGFPPLATQKPLIH